MVTVEELQAEVTALRAELRQLRTALDSNTYPVAESSSRVLSRRNLLRAAPVTALAGALATIGSTPALAAAGDPVLLGRVNSDANGTTTLNGGTPYQASASGVDATKAATLNCNGGVIGDWASFGAVALGGLYGPNLAMRVDGECQHFGIATFQGDVDVSGHTIAGSHAVFVNAEGPGVAMSISAGDGERTPDTADDPGQLFPGVGLRVRTETGAAVDAASAANVIAAVSTDSASAVDAVTVSYAGKSRAVYAESLGASNFNGTITGVNDGSKGIGLWGEQGNNGGAGFGVVGVGGSQGRGGRLSGGAANVQLLPGTAATHPATGKAGDLFVDASARLWYCQKTSSGGIAATWKQLA